jgi:drug/metabolite transporter (DMT)-like permease
VNKTILAHAAAATAALSAGAAVVAMLLGGFCAAIYSVFSRATLAKHGALFVTALAMVFAVIGLLPVAILNSGVKSIPTFSSEGWFAVLFLGTFAGALQFSLFTWALRWLPPTTTVLYLTLNPITAMLLGVLLIGEMLTIALVAGFLLVLCGILVGNGGLLSAWRRPALPNAATE